MFPFALGSLGAGASALRGGSVMTFVSAGGGGWGLTRTLSSTAMSVDAVSPAQAQATLSQSAEKELRLVKGKDWPEGAPLPISGRQQPVARVNHRPPPPEWPFHSREVVINVGLGSRQKGPGNSPWLLLLCFQQETCQDRTKQAGGARRGQKKGGNRTTVVSQVQRLAVLQAALCPLLCPTDRHLLLCTLGLQRAATMQLFFLVCLLLLSPQGASPRRHHPREMRKKVKEPLVEATAAPSRRDFAFDLYRALASTTPGQNVFFSPLSISLSLAMLALGARSNTKTQILEGLGLDLQARSEDEVHHGFQQLLHELTQPREDLQLSLGNTLFIDRKLDIQDAFLSAIRTLYLADAFSTDFEDFVGAKKQINDYVAKQTKGKVVELLKHLDGTQVMVMVNYIFFKAKWEMSFSPEDTREHDFHVRPEASVRVPMMNREDQYLYFLDRNLSCVVLRLRYQGNATALFILPEEGKMRQVEEGLSEKTLRKWLKMFTKRYSSGHSGAVWGAWPCPAASQQGGGVQGGGGRQGGLAQPVSCCQVRRHPMKSWPSSAGFPRMAPGWAVTARNERSTSPKQD
uniref:Serpin domain-containing protein n=1 Tax=Oryctolagus cuniculus TaxID=9986 RepID=G1SQG6_RABIT